MIELKGIHKAFGTQQVLRGVDLFVPVGKTLVIIGGSGQGKSVTLKHIVGLLKPDKGRVIVDDEDITDYSKKQLVSVRRKFGVLFQGSALLNWMNVQDNVALPLRELSNMREAEILDRVYDKLDALGLRDARRKMPSEISGGMKKRAGLARALIWDPPYLLYDEPTSGLDPVMTASVDRMIVEAREKFQVTSVVVSHDMASVYRIADTVAMMFKGRVIETGPPGQIRASQNPVVRQFTQGRLDGPMTTHRSTTGS